MFQSERRSLFRFLAIYLSSTLLLFLLATSIFYNFQKYQIIENQKNELDVEARKIVESLRGLSGQFNSPLIYPHHQPFDSAIYNLDKEYIFGSFHPNHIEWEKDYYQKEDRLFHLHALSPYYLGASYLLLTKKINQEPIDNLLKSSILFLCIAGLFFTLLGMFLGRLFIAPMKESMAQINRFIEDTTHEFNTPISTILTNIELLDTIYDCNGKKEMRRIEMASKTLSRLYEDLTYLKLNHNYHRESILLNISALMEERINYFYTLIEAKELKLIEDIFPDTIVKIDRNDAIRMVDNLLSNAIKYNKKGGELKIELNAKHLLVKNSGMGIKKEDIGLIQNRFRRANSSEGGFGIGLDIIGQVVEYYQFRFSISSIYTKYTEVIIEW